MFGKKKVEEVKDCKVIQEDHLWLTSGGRIVVPGVSESCQEPYDQMICSIYDLKKGIDAELFRNLLISIMKRRKIKMAASTIKDEIMKELEDI